MINGPKEVVNVDWTGLDFESANFAYVQNTPTTPFNLVINLNY